MRTRKPHYNPHAPDWHKVAPDNITLTDYAKAWIDMAPHVDQLRELASDAKTIVEFGLRGAVSTWALLDGLQSNGKLIGVDIDPTVPLPKRVREDPRFEFVVGNSLYVRLPPRADLVMIDSSHEFTQTVLELARAEQLRPRVIVCHDYLYQHTPHVRWAVDGFTHKGYITDPAYRLERVEQSKWGLAVLVPREPVE